eukprot:TRINITY_DN1959_c2_g1_i1.p1 TRINITY_DN1959_c2_g1~~TRINITY_DN1959_c2_g1_i1.p1  ORF type:complete len:550 (+),score=95.41 TRINITY_DN1959_c2_g1_i1:46-1695(+)
MSTRPHLLNYLTGVVEGGDSDREGGRSSGGSDPLRTPERPKRFMAGELIVPDSVGRHSLEDAVEVKRSLHEKNKGVGAMMMKQRTPVQPEKNFDEPVFEPSQQPIYPPVPHDEARNGRYVKAEVPSEVAPRLSTPQLCIVHTSCLNRGIDPTVTRVTWDAIDHTSSILVVSSDGTKSLGVVARGFITNHASKNVISLSEAVFTDTSLASMVSDKGWEKIHCIDDAWMQITEWDDSTPVPEGSYLPFVLEKLREEEKELRMKKAAEQKQQIQDTPPVVKSLPKVQFTKKRKIDADIIELDDEDEEEEKHDEVEIVATIPERPKPSMRAMPAVPPPAKERKVTPIDLDANEGEWKPRNTRRASRQTPTENPIFAPKTTLQKEYPCRSTFHQWATSASSHASRQCKYCASCHWMETLFNGEDGYCSWNHEPTVTKINRSKLCKEDKALALRRLKLWIKENEAAAEVVPVSRTRPGAVAGGTSYPPPLPLASTTTATVKKEDVKPPLLPLEDPIEDADDASVMFPPPFSPPTRRVLLTDPNPATIDPDENWEW